VQAGCPSADLTPPQQMFCSSHNPKDIGLKTEQTYVSQTGNPAIYCFELN